MSPSIDDNENDTSLPSPLVITVVATITITTPITLNIMISNGGRGVLLDFLGVMSYLIHVTGISTSLYDLLCNLVALVK